MTTVLDVHPPALDPEPSAAAEGQITRLSARFGLAFAICQVTTMIGMAIFVLPHGGRPTDPALTRGLHVLDAQDAYRIGNFIFMAAGVLLVGFLGAVHLRLRRADATGVLATVAVASGTLLALVWPLGGLLHDTALEVASTGADPRILGGWDSVAPYSLAFSALFRVFFLGAIVLGLGLADDARRLRRLGVVLIPLSLVGSATLLSEALFPFLALSTLGYELWVGALAWHWLRRS